MKLALIIILPLIILAIIGEILLAGFLVMIALGILSSIFNAAALAIGYWSAVVVAIILNIMFGIFSGSSK